MKRERKIRYERKTKDCYKMEIFTNGKWETILETDDFYEYRELLNKLYSKPWVKHRGGKHREIIKKI